MYADMIHHTKVNAYVCVCVHITHEHERIPIKTEIPVYRHASLFHDVSGLIVCCLYDGRANVLFSTVRDCHRAHSAAGARDLRSYILTALCYDSGGRSPRERGQVET